MRASDMLVWDTDSDAKSIFDVLDPTVQGKLERDISGCPVCHADLTTPISGDFLYFPNRITFGRLLSCGCDVKVRVRMMLKPCPQPERPLRENSDTWFEQDCYGNALRYWRAHYGVQTYELIDS